MKFYQASTHACHPSLMDRKMKGEEETQSYFVCPISLRLMKDPVTLSTGITYDRQSIERWFSVYDRNTCPVTNRLLLDRNLTPNSTLLRLIHSWGAQLSVDHVRKDDQVGVISDVVAGLKEPNHQFKSLKKMSGLLVQDTQVGGEGEVRACMEKSGVVDIVASIAGKHRMPETSTFSNPSANSIDEATSLLRLMNPSPVCLKKLVEFNDGELIRSLSCTMQKGCYKARIDALILLKSTFQVVEDRYKAAPPSDLFDGVIDILKDQNSDKGTTITALSIMMEVMHHGRNRAKAVESGAVAVLVELLVEEGDDRKKCEAMLAVLSVLCEKAEGRAAFLEHPAGIAAVTEKILKVSPTATEKGVKVLMLLCKFRGCRVVEEMMIVGGAAKLCLVIQAECSRKTKAMAKGILQLHLKDWSKYPCFPYYCSLRS